MNTLRDEIAMRVLAGFCANPAVTTRPAVTARDELADRCYAYADAMLRARGDAKAAEPAPHPKRKVTVYLASNVSMSAAEKVRDLLSWLAPHDPAFESANPFVDLIFRHALDGTCFSNVESDLLVDESTWIDHGGHDPAACARLHNAVMGIIGGQA